MTNFMFPDYTHSNLNLIHSILHNYGLQTQFPGLNNLPVTSFSSKCRIYMLLDGLGMNLINKYGDSACSFFSDHLFDTLSTVFPSTTTAAIPSLLSGKLPIQHGAIGWTLYMKEYGRLINYLPLTDMLSGKTLSEKDYLVYDFVGTDGFFQQLHQNNSKVDLHYLSPDYIVNSPFTQKMVKPAKTHGYTSFEDMLFIIEGICRYAKQETCIVCYSTQPDGFEHKHGVFSQEVKDYLLKINDEMSDFGQRLKGLDAELFITSDHGLIDIEEYLFLNEIPELFECLLLPTFPEPRFISFFVKETKKKKFVETFRRFENDFLLLTKEEFLEKKIMGTGDKHKKIEDFIGNFVAIAIGSKAMIMSYPDKKNQILLKAHHAGLTKDEMQIPLIWKKL